MYITSDVTSDGNTVRIQFRSIFIGFFSRWFIWFGHEFNGAQFRGNHIESLSGPSNENDIDSAGRAMRKRNYIATSLFNAHWWFRVLTQSRVATCVKSEMGRCISFKCMQSIWMSTKDRTNFRWCAHRVVQSKNWVNFMQQTVVHVRVGHRRSRQILMEQCNPHNNLI